jgi:hypothetical protein
MFIFWGTKEIKKKLGDVADYCPICRDFRKFKLIRHGAAGHLYGISLGNGKLIGFTKTCQTCKTLFDADPEIYASISKKDFSLPHLLSRTLPNANTLYSEQRELDKKLTAQPHAFTPDERKRLILHPFLLLSARVENFFESTHVDKPMAVAIAAGIIIWMLSAVVISQLTTFDPEETPMYLIASFLPGIFLVVWQTLGARRRYFQNQIIPLIVSNLKPLKPTPDELSSTLAELKTLRYSIGKKIKLADLIAGFSRHPGARSK